MLGGPLMEINANAFDICPSLRELRLNSNQLTTFPPGMLKNCRNLTSFGVINTWFQSVPEDLFGMTSNLELFTLSGYLTFLPEKLLVNMRKLNYVYISSNQLRELSPNFLINAPDLEEFIATGNRFQHQNDIAYALNGRTNLKVLWISNNDFSNFDFRFFTQFQKLRQLSIGSTMGPRLSDISWQSLPSSLRSLYVDGIGENIPENSFSRLVELEILSIHGYGIENLHKDTFKPLTKLFKLFIEGTRVNSLPSELLSNQINLIQLTIKRSYIHRLNVNSFGDHPYLRVIDFALNEINEIQRGIFSKFHTNLTSVNLWSNICISQYLYGENLDQHESLSSCFNNWEIIPDGPPILTTTTPAGCKRSFRNFEVFGAMFLGLIIILINQH